MTNTPKITKDENEADQVNPQKKDSIINDAIKAFIKSKLNQKDWLDFYNITSSNLDEFFSLGFKEEFLKYTEWIKDFKGIKSNEIENKKWVFVQEIMSFWIIYESKREALTKIVEREYEGWIPENLKIKINSLSSGELEAKIESLEKRESFIKKTLWKETPPKKDFLSFLSEINIEYEKLSKEQLDALISIQNWNYVNEDKLRHILSLFDYEWKQNIIKTFMPLISLKDLIKFNIITDKEARDSVKLIIEKDEKLKKMNSFDKDENILDKIDLEEIIIPTYLFPESVLDRVIEGGWLKKLEDEYNKLVDENNLKDKIEFKLDSAWKITPDFIKKVQEDPNLANKISGIEKLKNWAIFKTVRKDELWQEQAWYFRIDWLDSGLIYETKTLTISNLTNGWWVFKNENHIYPELLTYSKFYKFLEKLENWVFIEKDVFAESIKKWEIKQEVKEDEISTLEELNEKLDEIDEKWKQYKIEVGMSFETTKSGPEHSEKWVFSVTKIDNTSGKIWITNWQNEEWPFTFVEFFNWFQAQIWDGWRIQSVGNIEWFLSAIQNNSDEKLKKWFKELIVHNSKIIPQDRKDDKDFGWIEYFVWDDKKAVRIVEIKDWKVKLSTGEYTEWLMEKNKKWDDEKAPDSYKQEGKESRMWYEMLYLLINEKKAVPKIPVKPVREEALKDWPKVKWWLFKSWLAWKSVFDLVKWWKQFIDAIKHKLEQWSKLKAAEFAYSLWKNLHLPDDMLLDLKSSVQKSNHSVMEEIMWEISNLGWSDRMDRIRSVLENNWSQTYELQAVLLVTLKKYWILYPGWLSQYKWSYFWYKRFWWVVNDATFLKIKKNVEWSWEQFTEETLLREYFREKEVKERYNIKELFWIDIKNSWREWRESQIDTWNKDTKWLLTLDAWIDYAVNKLKWWEYYHVVSAIKNIWAKWWSGVEMNKIPFLLLMSGATKRLSQDEVSELKWHFIGWKSFPALWFINSGENIKLFQDVILKLSEWQWWKMETDAKELVKKERSGNYEEKELVWDLAKFWDEYWAILSPKLTLTKDPEIFLKKDEPGNIEYKLYYDSLKWMTTDDWYNLDKKEALWNHVYDYDHSLMALTWIKQFLEKWISSIRHDWAMDKHSMHIFEQVIKWMKNVKNIKSKDPIKDWQYQKKLYFEYTKGIMGFLADKMSDIENFMDTDTWITLLNLWIPLGLLSKENRTDIPKGEMIRDWLFDKEINDWFKNYLSKSINIEKKSTKTTKNVFEWKIEDILSKNTNQVRNQKSKQKRRKNNENDYDYDYDMAA
ncbi:MAG: hypothetical protein ACD_49C00060G0061 [uncultured bacterium (gcode 4)]|uniref:Uncharacterized protein n=1 Tax=uncultured bacterium (gcode 4) TaxID=1234023 RepID=K2BVH3_9BACT|nr:MAG: hypothetical protein ACD_49C00060G0061 [uncultured bacterium (gcode 4)]